MKSKQRFDEMSNGMNQILQTLAYHFLFEDPLTVEQIHEFLITPVPLSLTSVRRSVEQLSRQHQITRRGPYFTLLHVAQQNVRQHEDRMRASQEKLAIARRSVKVISFVPWVKLVAVTGALAMKNADEPDDIDLMIVTAQNRLWLTRPLVMLLVSLFFKRRKPAIRYPLSAIRYRNALCLNLWIDEDALAIPNSQRNLYTAHELAQMKPLVNRNGTYEQMMSINKWGSEFLANAWEEKETNGQVDQWTSRPMDKLIYWSIYPFIYLSNYLLSFFNLIAFKLQLLYMLPKMTTELVSLHAAYFHPGNRSRDILQRHQSLLEKMKIEKPKINVGDALLELAKHAVPGPKDLASNMFEYLYGEKSDFAMKKRKQTIK